MKNVNIILKFCLLLMVIDSNIFLAQSDSHKELQKEDTSFPFIEKFKSELNTHGIDLELVYKGEFFSNLSGGTERNSVYLDNFDFIFNLNLEKILGWKGANLTTYFLGNHGGEPAEYAGVIQGISNIAAHNTWKLFEFRLEQILLDGDLSLLAGLYNLNSEFDTREFSGIFINPSHGIGAEFALTGKNGPSIFPNTSLAIRASYNFSPKWNIKAAVFDGIPGDLNNPDGTRIVLDNEDGLLLTSEINFTNGSDEIDINYFKYAAGEWYYTGEFETISGVDILGNPVLQKGNYGFYVSAEKFLLSENNYSNQGLGAFIRLGWANNDVNSVNSYFGAGINYIGLIPGRDEDVFGIALAAAHNNQKYRDVMAEENITMKDFEYIFELTYNIIFNDWIQVQPDIQYVVNPAGCNRNNYSFVYGTRLQLSL